jgi:hypothetical protein
MGATAWRMVALHALGRWDEVTTELGRAERAWQESEIAAPSYALNGFLACFSVARSRGDVVLADRVRELVLRIQHRTDAFVRSRRFESFLDADFAAVAALIADFRQFTPRLDYVYLLTAFLADRRRPMPAAALDELIDYSVERELDLVSSQALRLRGLVRNDAEDLERALSVFARMGAMPFVARATAELGLLRGDGAAVERGLTQLETLGDLDHAARIAGERKAGALIASTPP